MQKIRVGEITPVGRLLEPETAIQLGSRMMELYHQYSREAFLFGNGTLNPDINPSDTEESKIIRRAENTVRLSENDFSIYNSLISYFKKEAISHVEHDEPIVSGDFFFGSAADGRWHIDANYDYRLLVNLSKFPISLLVANEWSSTSLGEGDNKSILDKSILDKGIEPESYSQLTYEPGEAVTVNNFCLERDQIPHAGSTESGKVFLRFLAYNPNGDDILRTRIT